MRIKLFVPLFALCCAGAAVADEPKPIASRGDASITIEDVDARMARVPEESRAATIGDPERLESILSAMLLTRQLAQEARAAGLHADPLVARQVELATESVLASNWLDRVKLEATADVAQLAREVFQSNRAKFALPERRVARHLLVGTVTRTKEAARAIAERALADARKPGADFAKIAAEVSDDESSREKGGLLPEFGPGVMDPAFEAAAFGLAKPGEISDVVETSYGFHVLQLVEIKPPTPRTFDEVRADLERQLLEKHRDETVRKHADTLRNLPLEADEKAVAALRTRYDQLARPAPAVKLPEDEAAPGAGAEAPKPRD